MANAVSVTVIALCAICALATTVRAALPKGVIACPVDTDLKTYNKCVLKQVEAITPYLAKGLPELKLPALDPLFLPRLEVDRNLENLKIRANMSDIRVFGATNYLIDDLRANPKELAVVIKAHMPYLHVKGNYDVQGRLLLLPLQGSGYFNGNFSNTEILATASGKEKVDKNGVTRIVMDKLVTKLRIGDGNIRLKTPPSHKLAADTASTFFNSNPRLVLDIAAPIIEDTAATIAKALAARALSTFTKDELIPQ